MRPLAPRIALLRLEPRVQRRQRRIGPPRVRNRGLEVALAPVEVIKPETRLRADSAASEPHAPNVHDSWRCVRMGHGARRRVCTAL